MKLSDQIKPLIEYAESIKADPMIDEKSKEKLLEINRAYIRILKRYCESTSELEKKEIEKFFKDFDLSKLHRKGKGKQKLC